MSAELSQSIYDTAVLPTIESPILNQRPGIYSIAYAKFDHHQDRIVCHFHVNVAGETIVVEANVRPVDIRPLGYDREPVLLIKSTGEYRLYLPWYHEAMGDELVQRNLQNRRRQ